MARTPKPWFWEKRKAWYTRIEGKTIRLHEDEAKARKEFYRVMAAEGQLDERQRGRMTVADATEAYIAQAQHHRESTRRMYAYNLTPWAVKFAKRRLDSIKHEEVIAFVATYQGTGYKGKTFGDASRYMMFRYIKSLFKWAKDIGTLERNQMHGKTCPWKVMARERVMTAEEYATLMGSKANARFKEVVEFLWKTGARPGEIACIQARHLDKHSTIVRLQPTEHKTGTKTGLQREIILPVELMDRLRAYAVERPKGRLLVRKNGKPWNQDRISDTFGYWKRRLGLAPDCVAYLARHAFGTRAIDAGSSIATVAKMLGHNDTGTLMKHYFHPDKQAMLDAVDKLNQPPSDT
jgi:integrase